jgi:hypothetical protein
MSCHVMQGRCSSRGNSKSSSKTSSSSSLRAEGQEGLRAHCRWEDNYNAILWLRLFTSISCELVLGVRAYNSRHPQVAPGVFDAFSFGCLLSPSGGCRKGFVRIAGE